MMHDDKAHFQMLDDYAASLSKATRRSGSAARKAQRKLDRPRRPEAASAASLNLTCRATKTVAQWTTPPQSIS